MPQVDRQQTPVSIGDFSSAFYNSLRRLGYGSAGPAAAAIAWAHFALETGYGQYCWNYNLGNHRWYSASETPELHHSGSGMGVWR